MIDKNKKILVLVESPTKCEKVKHFLSDLGYSKVKVLASKGHTTQLKNKADSYWNTGIYPDKDFKFSQEVIPTKKDVVSTIKLNLEWADIILFAEDPDREGEFLGYNLKELLKVKDKDYYRITYHSITKEAIEESLNNLRKFNPDLVEAAIARTVLDKMLGYRLSPVARKTVNCKSVGRCQSSALQILAERENEIINFKPEKYIDLFLNFKKNEIDFKAKYAGTKTTTIKRLSSQEEVDTIFAECKGHDFIINDIEYKDKKENPKPPFCTSSYQQECANKLGLSVETSIDIAQKLYESGYCTYLRTDDETMDEVFAKELLKFVRNTYGDDYTSSSVMSGKKDENAQEGHECFRVVNLTLTPTEFSNKINNDLMSKVYKLIYNRTIASAMKPAIISTTTYNILNNDKHKFILNSNEIKFDGYRKVYSYKESDDKEDIIKESFAKGEILHNCSLTALPKETTPPSRYKEASFMKELKDRGIGRPSTYTTIIKTIKSEDRGYCEVKDKYLVPTQKGLQLVDFLNKSFSDIINIDYTANMETQLDLIANGKINYLTFLKEFYTKLEGSANKVGRVSPEERVCPECGKALVKRYSPKSKKYFLGCSGYPNCKHIENI